MKQTSGITVVGLGYVGLPLLVEFSRIYPTIGFDINCKRIAELRAGIDVTHEVSACTLAGHTFSYTSDISDCSSSDIYVITVPTPVDKTNKPDLSSIIEATRSVSSVLEPGNVVIYESTVYPGLTEELCIPLLEKGSGLMVNRDFGVGYSPERINPGDKRNTLRTIKKVVSASSAEYLDMVDSLYLSIITAGTHRAGSIKIAEAAKVIENAQRDLNIAFVNELSLIFERMGIDTSEVLDAASTKWNFLNFRPGLVGGHCIGVDPYYLTFKAEEFGYNPQVILAGRRINENMGRYAARSIVRLMLSNGINATKATVGILGLTFKENCPDLRNSKVFDIIDELRSWNVDVIISDPFVEKEGLPEKYRDCFRTLSDFSVDALIVAVAHDEYKSLPVESLKRLFNVGYSNFIIGDLKSIYDKTNLKAGSFIPFRF